MTSGWQRTRLKYNRRRFRPRYVGDPIAVRPFHGFVIYPTIELSFATLLQNPTQIVFKGRDGVK